MQCETIFAADVFLIEDLKAVVTDVTPPGESPPTSVIRSDQDIKVTVSWKTTGSGTGMIAGEWHLLVFAESFGPGDEVILFEPGDDHIFALEPGPAPEYSNVIDISAGTLPVVGGHGVTLYKLTTSLTYFEATPGRVRGEMACYVEGPMIQIYDLGPI